MRWAIQYSQLGDVSLTFVVEEWLSVIRIKQHIKNIRKSFTDSTTCTRKGWTMRQKSGNWKKLPVILKHGSWHISKRKVLAVKDTDYSACIKSAYEKATWLLANWETYRQCLLQLACRVLHYGRVKSCKLHRRQNKSFIFTQIFTIITVILYENLFSSRDADLPHFKSKCLLKYMLWFHVH